MIDGYDWAGGREAMLRFGPAAGPVVALALPLFEEANRTRSFAVTLLRALAAHGIAGALPDLPGQGDSLVATQDARLAHLRSAFAAAVATLAGAGGRAVHAAAIRSGALLDGDARVASRWHLAPQPGSALCRELDRIAHHATHTAPPADGDAPTLRWIAGNAIAPALLAALADAVPVQGAHDAGPPVRTLRLTGDTQSADAHVAGPPLWRRAEPDNDVAFATLLAADLAAWVRQCAN